MNEGARARLVSGGLALSAFSLLSVAAWLEPSTAGHGTHRQLGLPPCTFLSLTGQPCPMCGATTTFALMAEGRVWEGFWNHPLGALLFLATLGVVGVGLAEALVPAARWERLARAADLRGTAAAATFLVAVIGGWTWKILTF